MTERVDASSLRSGNPDHELAAITALLRAGVVPSYQLAAFIEHVGSAVELVQMSETDRLFVPREAFHAVVGAVTAEDVAAAMRDVQAWRNRDLDARTVLDTEYPESLRAIFDRPPLLFVAGRWADDLDARSVAVVGTRRASVAGKKRARRLSTELVKAGFTVISGLAEGVDTQAHQAALAAGGRTIAVMGTGLDHIYPKANRSLAQQILDAGGALISQFFPHQTPRRWTFPLRNVVMSGLTLATVVVEASSTSGARMQARVALQHGRTVFLLRSLVAKHEWARRYVQEGAYGTRAIEVTSTQAIVDRLEGNGGTPHLLAG
jgi:DNA processing protein